MSGKKNRLERIQKFLILSSSLSFYYKSSNYFLRQQRWSIADSLITKQGNQFKETTFWRKRQTYFRPFPAESGLFEMISFRLEV